MNMVLQLDERILGYLNGDLVCALTFPETLQTLHDEVDQEEESDWTYRTLNHLSSEEDKWRDRISDMTFPDIIQPDTKFLGGKQYQRAFMLFHAVVVEALPDPFVLREYAPSGAGYLNGGRQRENWEHTMCQITSACLADITHPGINYLVKHVGHIVRRLFPIALEDIKEGRELSATFKLMPKSVEQYLKAEYDKMLWELMQKAAEVAYQCTEAMYSTINTNLPTFDPTKGQIYEDDDDSKVGFFSQVWKKVNGATEAKEFLRQQRSERATRKKFFMSDERTSMVTKDEVTEIINLSFQYILAIVDHLSIDYNFQLDFYLYQACKKAVRKTFLTTVAKCRLANYVQAR